MAISLNLVKYNGSIENPWNADAFQLLRHFLSNFKKKKNCTNQYMVKNANSKTFPITLMRT